MPFPPDLLRTIARITLFQICAWVISQQALALEIPDIPLFVSRPVAPIVMLDASRDHQLFYKAYNDYSDIDGDGTVDTTFKHTITYYGYFDPTKCYDYDATHKVFAPKQLADAERYCPEGQYWSGNFLNWAGMSRADIMRKVLFGGARSTDSASETVLERANLPSDAHSWAKYYDGSGNPTGNDLNKVTPFANGTATRTSFTLPNDLGSGTSQTLKLGSGFGYVGDQVVISRTSVHTGTATDSKYYGVITSASGGDTGEFGLDFRDSVAFSSANEYTAQNLSRTGISLCNTTGANSGRSESTTEPPVIRVARGNYMLWAANQKKQCRWSEEASNTQSSFSGGILSNGNRYGAATLLLSEIPASAENPSYRSVGLAKSGMAKPDYVAHVQTCVSGLIGTEHCKRYDQAEKPIGLLQKFGEGAHPRIFFGLVTGTFTRNISGGVVRKNANLTLSGNATNSNDEIDTATGVFTSYNGIIKTLSRLRIYGWDYSSFDYIQGDNCTYQQIGITSDGTGQTNGGYPATEGNCSSWGNPMSEIYIESLRYLAGKSSTAAFSDAASWPKDDAMGLPRPPTSWTDPLNASNYCAPLSVLIFNASVSSYDNDQAGTAFSSDTGWGALDKWTNKVGAGEGITGDTKFLVGSNGITSDGVCSAKTVSNLSEVNGICPETPSLRGAYGMAGAAYFAHTNPIRVALGGADDRTPYTVNTYGVSLATSVPRINVNVGGNNVVIQPAYRLDLGSGRYGTGTIVDFRIIKQDAISGKFYINWEDSNQGGDYDQDVLGLISYSVAGSQITVTTQVISASTSNGQGMGFIISGTNKDGPHFYSGVLGFSYLDPTSVTVTPNMNINGSGGCNTCNDQTDRTARSATFTVGTSGSAAVLQDPLYYATKWGGFQDLNSTQKPDSIATWDSKKVDGTLGSDGQPDNYFHMTNPSALEQALDTAFTAILSTTSASAVAANTPSVTTDAMIFQSRFNPLNWTGDVIAYKIDASTGTLAEEWAAQSQLPKGTRADERLILTQRDDTHAATPFRWNSLSPAQQALIQGRDTVTVGQSRLDYLRGDSSNEGSSPIQFRPRPVTVLGDLIDSSPIYVGTPAGQYASPNRFINAYLNTDYTAWRAGKLSRTSMIYVGANDGMLHGFDASTGAEKIAYIPTQVYPNLINLSNQAYNANHRYYVNGTPEVADARLGTGWKSVLVSGMRKGGTGVFALDVTDPEDFSESNATSIGLWEFSSKDDGDMGHVYGTPIVARMANGKWAAIVGNGYNSPGAVGDTPQKAALFIIFLEKAGSTWAAADYRKIIVDNAGLNGLTGVAAFDANLDGSPDSLYAGDLKGNLWKFDVSSSDPANWTVALFGSPLAVACTNTSNPCTRRQPITAAPAITRHPNNLTSALVLFGTGKYIENNDAVIDATTPAQSIYGVWDKGATTTRAEYQVQTISTTDGSSERTITSNAVDWIKHTGWVEDMPAQGERIITPPVVTNGIVFYNTFIPSSSSCDFGGTGYLMALRYDTGGLLTVTGKRADGATGEASIFMGKDSNVGGIMIGGALGGSTILVPGATSGIPDSQTTGTRHDNRGMPFGITISNATKLNPSDPKPDGTMINPNGMTGTRISWRELLQR